MKKVVVLGGGNGMSAILQGLKKYPVDISSVVSVCDDGKSTGRLREEFNTPAVGDLRRIIAALSEAEPEFCNLFNYRFKTTSDLNNHVVGNLILTAIFNTFENIQDGIEMLERVMKVKGKVIPYTLEKPVLVGKMKDGTTIIGEHNITLSEPQVDSVKYKRKVKVNPAVLKAIKEADLIILSMGSLYTSIIPNLLGKELISTIDNCKAKIMYVANMMTQPGETDNYKTSDHVNVLNNYLGTRKIEVVIANNGHISEELLKKYETLEQKEQVVFDKENLNGVEVIDDNFVAIGQDKIRYNPEKLSLAIYKYLVESSEQNVIY